MCLICERIWFLIKPLQFSHCLIDVTKPNNDKLNCLMFLIIVLCSEKKINRTYIEQKYVTKIFHKTVYHFLACS